MTEANYSTYNGLHWNPDIERRGLGDAVIRMNHVALIVADVGIAASFYSDIIGLQQIRRPDFDRHGAWFTMGNCELHLIKGIPLVHDGTNLIVCHISLEVKDTAQVLRKLIEFGIPFEQNISVPKGQGKAASEGGSQGNTLTQYFLRDPSGYYIELCNCQILTDFCLKNAPISINGYEEGSHKATPRPLPLKIVAKFEALAVLAKHHLLRDLPEKHDRQLENVKRATEINQTLLKNFLKRRVVYGDLVQAFTEEEIYEIILQSGNHAPTTILIMRRLIEDGAHSLHYQPPAYYQYNMSGKGGDCRIFKPNVLEVIASQSWKSNPLTSRSRSSDTSRLPLPTINQTLPTSVSPLTIPPIPSKLSSKSTSASSNSQPKDSAHDQDDDDIDHEPLFTSKMMYESFISNIQKLSCCFIGVE